MNQYLYFWMMLLFMTGLKSAPKQVFLKVQTWLGRVQYTDILPLRLNKKKKTKNNIQIVFLDLADTCILFSC